MTSRKQDNTSGSGVSTVAAGSKVRRSRKRRLRESPEFGEWMTDEGPEEEDEDTMALMIGSDK